MLDNEDIAQSFKLHSMLTKPSQKIMECNEAKFALFKEGPDIMQVKSMEERLRNIEEINR